MASGNFGACSNIQLSSPLLKEMDVRSVKRRSTSVSTTADDSGLGMVDRMQPQAKQVSVL